MMKKFGIGIALGADGAILLAIIGWITVVYTGAYNVAASDPHSPSPAASDANAESKAEAPAQH